MCGHLTVFGEVLAGANVHSAVNLTAVGRDYLARFPLRRKGTGKFNGKFRLAAGRRTKDAYRVPAPLFY